MADTVLTVRQITTLIPYTHGAIYYWIRIGRLPARREHNRLVVQREDLRVFLIRYEHRLQYAKYRYLDLPK